MGEPKEEYLSISELGEGISSSGRGKRRQKRGRKERRESQTGQDDVAHSIQSKTGGKRNWITGKKNERAKPAIKRTEEERLCVCAECMKKRKES